MTPGVQGSIVQTLQRKHIGHSMHCHTSRAAHSGAERSPTDACVGSHNPQLCSSMGAHTSVSRRTMPPDQYAARQRMLEASASAQQAAAKRRGVCAGGSDIGPLLRCQQLRQTHKARTPLPARAVPDGVYMAGMAPFRVAKRIGKMPLQQWGLDSG